MRSLRPPQAWRVPRYVPPFVGARYPVQSGQVGTGWSAQRLYPGISLPSPGVRRTFHHPGNVRVLEVNIYYFYHAGSATACRRC